MPIVAWWIISGGVAGAFALAGWGAKSAGDGVGTAAAETGQGLHEALRIALPIAAVGVSLYLYKKGAN
jgi:O-antigen/teichoic acid export membrane protein